MSDGVDLSAWRSISDAMVNNRCWLCAAVFARGKVKKTFSVEQLVRFLYASHESHAPANPALAKCWEAFRAMGRDQRVLADSLEAAEMRLWMSGLVCVRSAECAAAFDELVSNADATVPIVSAGGEKQCPPNCGCDNPWPFLSPDSAS